MTPDELAAEVIKKVKGIVTDENIRLVVATFEGVKIGANNEWENSLRKTTNEALIKEKVTCKGCGRQILVERKARRVTTSLLHH